jgi:glycosyltransferase involved in cell wall biosynthesis
MKILITCLSKSWGGLEMYSLTMALQLQKKNLEVHLLCSPNSRLFDEAVKNGISVHPFEYNHYFHPGKILRFIKLNRKEKFDIIHSADTKDLWLIVPALHLGGFNTPLIISKQVGSSINKKDFLHRFLYKRVGCAIAISEVIKTNLLETTILTEDKVVLLHDATDTSKFDPSTIDHKKVRKEFNIKDNELLIGMMARFTPGKGHEEFLYASQKLLAKYNNIKFMVIGEPSKGEDKYAENILLLADKLMIKNNVCFTGFRVDIPEVLGALDIFVFPSRAESFGLALIEAMSMGIPSVCTNYGGVLDIAVDGYTSYLFQKENADNLADKVELLIESASLREKFGKASRQRVIEMFDLDVFTNRLINIYKSTQKNHSNIALEMSND